MNGAQFPLALVAWLLVSTLVITGVVVAVVLSFFSKRHSEPDAAQPGWVRTNEVFRDPSTDRIMRVWLDTEGSRRYIPD